MAQEDFHLGDAGLALGLSLGGGGASDAGHHSRSSQQGREALVPSPRALEPSLTLSMPGEATATGTASGGGGGARSVSSLSVKRERVEEAEVERASSTVAARAAEDDDDGSTRKKLRLTKEQSALLEDRFKEHSTLNPIEAESRFGQATEPQTKAGRGVVPKQTSKDKAEADGGGLRVPQALLRDAHRGEPPPAARAAGAPRPQALRPGAAAVLHAAAGRHAHHLPVLRPPGRRPGHRRRRQGRPRQAQGGPDHPPLLQPLHPLRRVLIDPPFVHQQE